MPKRKYEPDLAKLADDANDAMTVMANAGYIKEVDAIRNFIRAQGEHFMKMQKIQRDVANDLSKRLKASGGASG